MAEQVDVVVIGLGVGGEEVAGRLAEAGLSVVGVEAGLVGGECPYWGCVPTKMMVRAAGLVADARRAETVAGRASIDADWSLVADRIRSEATDTWDDQVAVDRFVGKGGTFLRGRARITGRGEVTVGDRVFTARRGIVLATGTVPSVPPIPGLADVPYWTNRDAVQVEQPPASLVVIGGGAIGVEFAQVFSRFGTAMTIVEAADRLLPGEEPEAGQLLAEVLAGEGIDVRTATSVERVDHDGTRFTVALGAGGTVVAEHVLVATGRRAVLADLGVDAYGVPTAASAVETDDRLRVAEGLWAVGDLTGHGAFTHVAMYQADIVRARHPRPGRARCQLPRGSAGHLRRPRGRVRRTDRGPGPRGRSHGQGRVRPGAVLGPRLDPQGRQRWAHQARRGRRPGSPRRRHLRRSARW